MSAVFPNGIKDFGLDKLDGDTLLAGDTNDLRAEVAALESYLLGCGGWVPVSSSWTYVSASSFSLAGDQSAVYSRGLRLCWTQTLVKYGVVTGSAYSGATGLTTVTLAVNNDYVFADAAVIAASVSWQAHPMGWPGWFNYTPVFGGFSAAPASPLARYNLVGNLCTFILQCPNNGTSNANTFTVTAPLALAAGGSNAYAGGILAVDNGVYLNNVTAVLPAGSNSISLRTAGFNQLGWTPSGGKRANFGLVYEYS